MSDLEEIRKQISTSAFREVVDPERLRAALLDRDEVTTLLKLAIDLLSRSQYHNQDEWLVAAMRAHRALIEGWPRN
jgi:hypothetical protein